MPRSPPLRRFCAFCGSRLSSDDVASDIGILRPCIDCERVNSGEAPFASPSLLVLTIIFAENKILLHQRGREPYIGKWATPGGFVESHESLEAAAIREVEEEVALELAPESLIPHAIISLPELNQVYVVYLAILEYAARSVPVYPEALDVRWFAEDEMLSADLWPPGLKFDVRRIYDRARTGRLEVYQQSETFLRVVTTGSKIDYFWRKE